MIPNPLTPQDTAEQAWDALVRHDRRKLASPSLIDDPAWNAEWNRLHQRFYEIYVSEADRTNVIPIWELYR